MENKFKVTIIIPANNAESTLGNTIDSAVNQTYKDLEIIVVNDGSDDRTQMIADEYSEADSRITVLSHDKNRGVSAARNTGLRAATGDYIMFLDADDELVPDAVKYCLAAALHYKADYVDSYQVVHLSDSNGSVKTFTEAKLPEKAQEYGSINDSPEIADMYWYVKGKLFRRSLIQDVFFDESMDIYEDLVFDMLIKSKLENYVFLKEPVYHYHQSISSYVNTRGKQHLLYLQAIEKIKPVYSRKPAEVRDRVYSLLYKNAVLAILFKLQTQNGKKADLKTVRRALMKLDDLLPDTRNNPLIPKALTALTNRCIRSSAFLNLVYSFTSKINGIKLYFNHLNLHNHCDPEIRQSLIAKKKVRINMLSMADSVKGQGVGSAYLELLGLIREYGKDDFELQINESVRDSDIVHIHTVEPINFIKMKLTDKPVVAYVHFLPETLDGSLKIPGIFMQIFKKYVVHFYESADVLVVVNPHFIDKLADIGISREKVVYIPNFATKKEYYELSSDEKKDVRDHLFEEYGIPQDSFLVMGCGQVQTRKGVLDFIEIAEKLKDIQFIWVGGFSFGVITDGYKELSYYMENPPENVTFTGIVSSDEMNLYYNAADLLFIPSYNELFPMTILESANTRTPILMRKLDLYQPILGKNYLSGNDNEDFAAKIERLKNDKKYYAEASEFSLRISQFYSEERIYKKWKRFYLSLR